MAECAVGHAELRSQAVAGFVAADAFEHAGQVKSRQTRASGHGCMTACTLRTEMDGVRERDVRPYGLRQWLVRGALQFLGRMASAAISQMGADIRTSVAGGALGVARARDLGLMAVDTVGAETGVGMDSGPRFHMARMRALGEKLSGQAGGGEERGPVRGAVRLLADPRGV